MDKRIFVILFLPLISISLEGTTCKMDDSKKVDCGWMGVDQRGCEDMGCCWERSSKANVPWCFYTIPDGDSTGTCNVQDSQKIDCGYVGINKNQCETIGCCWAESHTSGIPWCYNKDSSGEHTPPECDIKDNEKYLCGFDGIEEVECKASGCCWAPSSKKGVPWCYSDKPSGGDDEEMDWDFGD